MCKILEKNEENLPDIEWLMSENVHPKKFHILVHLCKIIEKKKQKGMGFCKKRTY